MARKVTMTQVRRAQKAAQRAELDAKIDQIRTEEAKASSEVKRRKLRAKRVEFEAQRYRLRQRRNGNGR
jgi:hypothetical protein